MANYNTLKTAIQEVIKTNGNEEITGQVLQDSLVAMINSLGAGYQFVGVATPETNPGTPDQNVFYIGGAGTYSNFGTAIEIPQGSLCVFAYNGNWVKNTISIANIINDLITGGANNVLSAEQGKVLKQEINQLAKYFALFDGNNLEPYLISGYYIKTGISNIGDVIDITPIELSGYGYICLPYYKDKEIIISGDGGSQPRLWAFLDVNKRLVSRSGSSATANELTISSEQDGYIVINFNLSTSHSARVAYVPKSVVDEISERVSELSESIGGLPEKVEKNEIIIDTYSEAFFNNIVGGTENFIDIDSYEAEGNPDIVPGSYIKIDGTIGTSSAFYISPYILVVPGMQYKSYHIANPKYGSLGEFCSLDKSQIGVIGYTASSAAPLENNTLVFEVPSNCYYIRLNIFHDSSTPNQDNKMLVKGTSSVTTYRKYGYDYNPITKRIEEKIVNIADVFPFVGKVGSFVGDSITYGYIPGGGGSQYAEQYRWVNIVGTKLKLATINNYGISGSTIAVKENDESTRSPMVNRVDSIDANSDLIVVAGGSNDYAHSWTPFGSIDTDFGNAATVYTFCGALDIMCRRLINRFPKKKIVFLTPIKRDLNGANSLGKTLVDYCQAIQSVCAKYGIPVFNMYSNVCINPYFPGDTLNSTTSPQYSLLIPDGTHPNEDGHSVIASSVFPFINNV